MADISKTLETIMEQVREAFASKNHAREKALPLCRDSIRFSANAIRAVHRHEFDEMVGRIEAGEDPESVMGEDDLATGAGDEMF